MKKQIGLISLLCASVFGQKAETVAFLAPLSPANEVPALNSTASATCVLWLHTMTDAAGNITSGSMDFIVHYTVPAPVTFTGLHVHSGVAGANGPVVFNTGLAAGANSVASDASGKGVIVRQAQILSTDATALALAKTILSDPSQAYCNIHTTDNPGGLMRAQLRRAEVVYRIGTMSTKKEVPAIDAAATGSGIGSIVALRAFDGGTFVSGWVNFEVDYNLGSQATITGLHIHTGDSTVAGPVTINTGLSAANSVTTSSAGTGNITIGVEVPPTSAAATISALNGVFENPSGYYVNMHTSVFPGGVIRSQLLPTENIRFPFVASPATEVPAITNVTANGLGFIDIRAVRDRTGAITAARVNFDFNHRFNTASEITGLHIHDGNATVSGPVTINTGLSAANSIKSDTGNGNVSRAVNVSTGQALTSLNDLVINPELHYANMHTVVNPGGVLRGNLGVANTQTPQVRAVINAVSDVNLRTVAQGGLMTIFGSDLVKQGALVQGLDDTRLPTSLNGTSVKIGGVDAPMMWADNDATKSLPSFLVVQVPFETPVGPQAVTVKTPNGTSAAVNVTVAAAAPGVFFDTDGTIAVKTSDLSLIRTDNAARAGDSIAIVATGLGRTNPALATGQLPLAGTTVAGTVTATIGGQNAAVTSAVALVNQPGYYLVVVTVPAGLTGSTAPVVVKVGDVASNTTSLRIR